MFWIDFLLAFFIAFILVGVLAAAGRGRYGGTWVGILWLFALVFLVTWAVGIWIEPVGPQVWGVSRVPFVLVAVFVALLIVAVAEPSRRWPSTGGTSKPLPPAEGETEPIGEREEIEAAAVFGCGIFFWIFVVLAVISIIARYAW